MYNVQKILYKECKSNGRIKRSNIKKCKNSLKK